MGARRDQKPKREIKSINSAVSNSRGVVSSQHKG